jgi:hypothetical protein
LTAHLASNRRPPAIGRPSWSAKFGAREPDVCSLTQYHAPRVSGEGGQTLCHTKQGRRLLLGVDGRHGLIRRAALHVEPIGVRRLEPRTLDLVAAREGLHLTALGLLVAEVDREQVPSPQIGQVVDSGSPIGTTVHRGTRSVRLRCMRAGNHVREREIRMWGRHRRAPKAADTGCATDGNASLDRAQPLRLPGTQR